MTCREFMDAAELLTPSQLLRLPAEEQLLSAHASECGSCREWLESHRALGNALQDVAVLLRGVWSLRHDRSDQAMRRPLSIPTRKRTTAMTSSTWMNAPIV